MAGFFDRFLKKKEVKAEKHLEIEEIPAYLSSKEAEVEERIISASDKARKSAIRGLEEIKDKIQLLENLGEDDVKHPSPKVRHTAMKSKKNFLDSIEKTLSSYSELPEDPDLLYQELIGLIRSVANNMRRQGKYLHPAFPDEMKEIKTSLDVIGKGLNEMTGDFKPSVEIREKISLCRRDYERLALAASEIKEIELKRADAGERLNILDKERSDLESERKEIISSGEYAGYESLKGELDSLREKKEEISARYGGLVASCGNVLRKTAYIAEKNGDREVSEKLDYLVVLLHSGERKDSGEASDLYRELYPYINGIIAENDSLIKNKNEEHLFSSSGMFTLQLDEMCNAYFETVSKMDSLKERISDTGIEKMLDEADKKIRDTNMETETLTGEIESGQLRAGDLEESVPGILEDMTELLSVIEEGEVVIEGDWRESPKA